MSMSPTKMANIIAVNRSPRRREQQRQQMIQRNANPLWRNRCSFLSEDQKAAVVDDVRQHPEDTYYDIAERHLITASHTRKLANAAGLFRKPRHLNKNNLERMEKIAQCATPYDAELIRWAIKRLAARFLIKRKRRDFL